MKDEGAPARRRIWDAPVRVFHWALVCCFATSWLTRDASDLAVHVAAGDAALVLLALRIGWGFVGSATARFRNFVTGPAAAAGYLRDTLAGRAAVFAGHNPAGGWSVLVMGGLLLVQCVLGLVLQSAQYGEGPFGAAAAAQWALRMRPLHEAIAWLLLGLVGVHLLGVAVGSLGHRENLVAAIWTGCKRHLPPGAPSVPGHGGTAIVLLGAAAGAAAAALWTGGWPGGAAAAPAVVPDAAHAAPARWREECGSCHLAYPPELLPARAWQRLLQEQHAHFGEDLGLSASSLQALQDIAATAGQGGRWAGLALRESVPADAAPQRISETGFWRQRHARIDAARMHTPAVAGPHACEACHDDAASAIFAPRAFRRPE